MVQLNTDQLVNMHQVGQNSSTNLSFFVSLILDLESNATSDWINYTSDWINYLV